MVCRYAVPLAMTFALGMLPLLLINQALLGWMMDVEYREASFYTEESGAVARYLWDMTLLVVLEAPLASIFTTAFLGKAMFVDRPSVAEVFADVLRLLPRIAWCQLLVRGVLPAWLLLLTLDRYGEFDVALEFLLLGSLTGGALLLRAFRPYLNEIVLLERNPLRAAAPGTITVGRRSGQLHGPSSGDLLGVSLGTAMFAVLLTAAVMGSFLFISGVFLNDWKPGPVMIAYFFPLSMWLVAAYLTVVRFLCYLDLRIRHEGWEVELRMRAEAARLAGQRT